MAIRLLELPPPVQDEHDVAGLAVYQLVPKETRYLHWEVFTQRCYSFNGVIQFQPGDIVVDIGANIGMFALWASLEADLTALFAYEPLQQQFDVLQSNIELHGLADKVYPKMVGVGEARKDSEAFTFFPAMPSSSTRHLDEKLALQGDAMTVNRFENAQVQNCKIVTFSDVLDDVKRKLREKERSTRFSLMNG
eukprot:m.332921 g.332921  ORF g.332921 m.332921 type:complete len:193 (-) comp17029_c0_seq1:1448-2026(-)